MSEPKVEVHLEGLQKAHRETLRVAGTVKESDRLLQLREGKATPLWLVGHLANTVNIVLVYMTLDKPFVLPKEFGKLFAPDFGGGMPPSTDASAYPAWEEVLVAYDTAMQAGISGVAELSDGDLPAEPRGKMPEPLRTYFPSIGATLLQMVQHDAYHRGQIGLLSKLNP
ncbi:MAG: DinB family protein [Candidatus Hydrogenedentes bacterium]|nr:DinB family protein [Candidatus Hydrogenedentota bacterium]